RQIYPRSLHDALPISGELTAEQLTDALVSDALEQYDDLEERISAIGGEKQMRDTERMIILPVIDNKWREHLYEMDYQGGHRPARSEEHTSELQSRFEL